jgi:queuosine precursor transporter
LSTLRAVLARAPRAASRTPLAPPSGARFQFINVLTALNVTLLLVSDFTGARVIGIGGVGVSVTVLYFPLTYLIGDVLTEVYGYGQSRRVIWISLGCSIAGSLIAAGQLAVPAATFFASDAAYEVVFSVSLRTALAGLAAFFAGDICNSYVLAKMKIWDQGRRLWARFVASTIVGEGVNTALFYGIALHGVLPQRLLWESILVGWAAKVVVEVVMLPVAYAVVRFLKRAEGVDHYDFDTDFNPFLVR